MEELLSFTNTRPLQAATQATLGNASWFRYHCSRQLCPPIRNPSNSGSDVIFLRQYGDLGETDFIDLFDYNKADVIQDSSPVQSVQGRIAPRKAWWFNNFQISALVFGFLLNCYVIYLHFVTLRTIEVCL